MRSSSAAAVLGLLIWSAPSAPAQQEAAPAASQPSVMAVDPGTLSIQSLLTLSQQLIDSKQFAQATRMLEAVLARDAKNVEALSLMGEANEKSGDVYAARNYYKRVLDISRGEYKANVGLGRAYVASNMPRQAIAFLEQAEKTAPAGKRPETLALLARAQRAMGDRTAAAATAEKAIKEDPTYFDAWQTLITTRGDAKQFDRALTDSQALVELCARRARDNPIDVPVLRQLDAAYDLRLWVLRELVRSLNARTPAGVITDALLPGKEPEAAAAISQFIEVRLRQSQLRDLLSRHELLSSAEQAVKYDPRNPAYLEQWGLLLVSVSDYENAAKAFERVLEVDPNHPTARRQLEELRGGGSVSAMP